MITIHSIVYQPGPSEATEPYRFNREPAEQVNLIKEHGIEGDFKAGRNLNRQINIMSREMLDQLAEEGFRTEPGEMGEQIVISGFDVMTLNKGDRLRLGEVSVIEITSVRTGCDWLEKIQGRPTIKQTKDRLGMMAKVIVDGTISVGDEVRVLMAETE